MTVKKINLRRKSPRRKSPRRKSPRRKSPSPRRKSPKKCPKGTRLLKKPVKEGGKMRYCTKPKKSPRRKCPKGTRLLKKPVKEGGKMRYCTKPKKSPRRTKKEGYTCNRVYDDYTFEYVGSSCDKKRGGEFGNLDECLKSGCEGMRKVDDISGLSDEEDCRSKWCSGGLEGKPLPWRKCYKTSALEFHPDKHPGEEEKYTRLFSELNDCNQKSKHW